MLITQNYYHLISYDILYLTKEMRGMMGEMKEPEKRI